jgi:K+-dependent Na+/Ca+ exchanger related-protein
MLLPIVAIAAGIVFLLWSADKFVEGAAAVAERLGISQIVIGMVIVGFGTSLPEMTVSALSAWQGAPGLALGNAYGSNIANITLILGVAAVVNPIRVKQGLVKREIPVLIAITLISILLFCFDMTISRVDAIILLVIFAIGMWLSTRGSADSAASGDVEEEKPAVMSLNSGIFWVVVGLVVLMASSQSLVWGAIQVARALGVSELTIGLTVVAVGTSLPELASSLAAARKNRHDIAIGNVIGSNIFNTLVVVGIAGLIKPLAVEPAILTRDMPALVFVTAILYFLCRKGRHDNGVVTRGEGVGLLVLFVLYTAWVGYTSFGA